MIKREVYEEALYQACRKAATSISKDVEKAFLDAIAKETNPAAKKGFQATLDSLYKSIERDNAACADTGWPLYFFKIGVDCQLEGACSAWKKRRAAPWPAARKPATSARP